MRAMSVRLRRLMQEEVKRQRLEHELDIGRRIQLSLLPERSPSFEGWQFATHYRAARQIGGDFYDFIAQSNHPDQLNLVVADVTGKGVPAAIFMAVVRTMIRAESAYGRNPSRTLDRTNKLILSDNRTPLFLSAFFGRLNTSDGRLTYASAGHDPSFVLRHDSGSIETLEARGMVLGAYDFMQFEEKITTLNSGDALIAYTDGVTEARNADGEFFGDERLLAVLSTGHGCPANELVTLVTDAIHEFAGETPQADDLTIVVVKRL